MTLAAFSDANRYLDENKLSFANDIDATKEATEVDRIIRGTLFSVYGTVVNDWEVDSLTSPTPNLIIEIAGMLMAASRYAKKYAEETTQESDYASRLKNQANSLIEQIRSGQITLEDLEGVSFTEADFWPNDTTVDEAGDPLRFATIDKVF
jgi:hypothetical protein